VEKLTLAGYLLIGQSSKFTSYLSSQFSQGGKQDKPVLFPRSMDDAVMETDQAWAASLRRTRHIGIFRAWKDHDAYQKSFNRLLRDLKA
jgi:hypothetical protein